MTKALVKKLNAVVMAVAVAIALGTFALTPQSGSSMMFGNCADPSECTKHTGGMEVCEGPCPSPTHICCAPE